MYQDDQNIVNLIDSQKSEIINKISSNKNELVRGASQMVGDQLITIAALGSSFGTSSFAEMAIAGVRATDSLLLRSWVTVLDNSAVNIAWGPGTSIAKQGIPWENYLANQMLLEERLPKNFMTFDFWNDITGLATSAKTLNTMTIAKINDPVSVYSSIKSNIDAIVNFEGAELKGTSIVADQISIRELQIAVPAGTNFSQSVAINKAILYGQSVGVRVIVTVIK